MELGGQLLGRVYGSDGIEITTYTYDFGSTVSRNSIGYSTTTLVGDTTFTCSSGSANNRHNIIGKVTFNGNNCFNGYSSITTTITGDVTFNGYSYNNAGGSGTTIYGNVTFNNNSGN